MGITGIIAAIAVLGILIVVHEFGHFIVAKKSGVGILKFSVGFGPKLFGRTYNGTEYVLSAIPLGGFVKMVGEDPDSEEPVDEAISFSHQPLWKRCAIVLAGPTFNLLFAFVAFSCMFYLYGRPVPEEGAVVGMVQEGKPAATAGFQNGDTIVSIDGSSIETWEALSEAIRGSGGKALTVEVMRDGAAKTLSVTPEKQEPRDVFGEVTGPSYYAIGIGHATARQPVGMFQAVSEGLTHTVWWITTIAISVYKMVCGHIPAEEIGGPILIVQAAGAQAQVGLEALVNFMSVISINLGILNLLPIPVLDGGHLLFFLIEGVMRRPLDLRQREMAQQVGLVILIGLMAFAFYNDIGRLLASWG
jgi:regulator of sigma E protease